MADNSDRGELLISLRSVADGASLYLVGTIVVNLLGFLLTIVLTRMLGAGTYGIYAYGTMLIASVLTFANFGTDVSITRYLSANNRNPAYQNRVLGLSYLTTLALSLVTGGVIIVAAPTINAYTLDEPVFKLVLQVFAIALPFKALTIISSNTFRGLEMPVEKTVITIVGPVLQLITVVAAVALGYSVVGVAAAYALACAGTFLFAFAFTLRRTDVVPTIRLHRSEVVEFYNFSAPLSFSKACSFLFKRADVLMVGLFLTSTSVGIYNVAVLLAGIIAMPLSGINQLFPPVASRLYSNGRRAELESIYTTVIRWSITASLVIALPMIFFRTEVLALFGPEFTAGATVVVLFVLGQLVNSAAGPANDLLTMTDHQYVVMVNHASFGIINIALNYVLILEYGLIGAALATAGVLTALNVVRVLEVWYFEGLFGYSLALWKPLIAGGVSTVVMFTIGLQLDGVLLLIVGGVSGMGAFVGCIYALGLDERDRRLFGNYLRQFT